jgi:hypothetical protein
VRRGVAERIGGLHQPPGQVVVVPGGGVERIGLRRHLAGGVHRVGGGARRGADLLDQVARIVVFEPGDERGADRFALDDRGRDLAPEVVVGRLAAGAGRVDGGELLAVQVVLVHPLAARLAVRSGLGHPDPVAEPVVLGRPHLASGAGESGDLARRVVRVPFLPRDGGAARRRVGRERDGGEPSRPVVRRHGHAVLGVDDVRALAAGVVAVPDRRPRGGRLGAGLLHGDRGRLRLHQPPRGVVAQVGGEVGGRGPGRVPARTRDLDDQASVVHVPGGDQVGVAVLDPLADQLVVGVVLVLDGLRTAGPGGRVRRLDHVVVGVVAVDDLAGETGRIERHGRQPVGGVVDVVGPFQSAAGLTADQVACRVIGVRLQHHVARRRGPVELHTDGLHLMQQVVAVVGVGDPAPHSVRPVRQPALAVVRVELEDHVDGRSRIDRAARPAQQGSRFEFAPVGVAVADDGAELVRHAGPRARLIPGVGDDAALRPRDGLHPSLLVVGEGGRPRRVASGRVDDALGELVAVGVVGEAGLRGVGDAADLVAHRGTGLRRQPAESVVGERGRDAVGVGVRHLGTRDQAADAVIAVPGLQTAGGDLGRQVTGRRVGVGPFVALGVPLRLHQARRGRAAAHGRLGAVGIGGDRFPPVGEVRRGGQDLLGLLAVRRVLVPGRVRVVGGV